MVHHHGKVTIATATLQAEVAGGGEDTMDMEDREGGRGRCRAKRMLGKAREASESTVVGGDSSMYKKEEIEMNN
jgi:hypothetical protein